MAEADDIELQDATDFPLLKGDSNHNTTAASATEPESAVQVTSEAERLLVNIRDLLETSVSMMARVRREKDENERMMNDWMVAAAVIDRISFILITIFFAIGTVVLLALCFAPHDWKLSNIMLLIIPYTCLPDLWQNTTFIYTVGQRRRLTFTLGYSKIKLGYTVQNNWKFTSKFVIIYSSWA